MTANLKPTLIAGVVYYPRDTYVLNTTFDTDSQKNDKYILTCGQISDAAAAALEGMGIKVKVKDTPGKHFTAKSKYPHKFYDEEGNEIPSERVGSGSKIKVPVTPYRNKMSKMHGAFASAGKIIVTDLVEYNPEGAIEDAEEAL